MSMPCAIDLLRIWEQGQKVSSPEKALLLLSWDPSGSDDLPVGERDRRLLALRERLFGREMTCVTDCPVCGEPLEVCVDTRQFEVITPPQEELELQQDGFRIRYRVPSALDLVACAGEGGVAAAERLLWRHCILEARREDDALEVEELPEPLLEHVAKAMESVDPGADLQLESLCPHCSQRWESAFDIGTFLWIELHDWAIRMLRDIHVLASAYGWSERDILDISPWRRRLYLQMAGS